jgi:hypothetical protein
LPGIETRAGRHNVNDSILYQKMIFIILNKINVLKLVHNSCNSDNSLYLNAFKNYQLLRLYHCMHAEYWHACRISLHACRIFYCMHAVLCMQSANLHACSTCMQYMHAACMHQFGREVTMCRFQTWTCDLRGINGVGARRPLSSNLSILVLVSCNLWILEPYSLIENRLNTVVSSGKGK